MTVSHPELPELGTDETRSSLKVTTPTVSIIIPAYNEEGVIRRTLAHLLAGAGDNEFEILVCCNGCRDKTAEIAREFEPQVRVLEIVEGSKTKALNSGDEAAQVFPRIYLDADILLNATTIRSIIRGLSESNSLAVAPRVKVDLTNRSWAIRAFYNVWLKTPYHQQGMIGSGVYALSEQGRKRFDRFPDIIADDGFVRAHFGPHERRILDDCEFQIIPPETVSGLLKIKTRATLGNQELTRKYPELMRQLVAKESQNPKRSPTPWRLVANPWWWPHLGVYVLVKTVARWRARAQIKQLHCYQWERDETSRRT